MNKKFLFLSKIFGLIVFYLLIFVASVFFTMSFLIKGDEIKTPDFIGKSLKEAYEIASSEGIYLKKKKGNFSKDDQPLTVIDQFPTVGSKIKGKSTVIIFVTSDLIEVDVPDLSGYNLKRSVEMLEKKGLKKGYVSYIEAEDVPVDFVIAQSYPFGVNVPEGTEIDILVSRGKKEKSFIMPDIIGMKAADVLFFFEKKGLKISKITDVPYPGLESGIIIRQFPSSGHWINAKVRIGIEVSE